MLAAGSGTVSRRPILGHPPAHHFTSVRTVLMRRWRITCRIHRTIAFHIDPVRIVTRENRVIPELHRARVTAVPGPTMPRQDDGMVQVPGKPAIPATHHLCPVWKNAIAVE